MNKKIISIIVTSVAIVITVIVTIVTSHNTKTAKKFDKLYNSAISEIFVMVDGLDKCTTTQKMLGYVMQNKDRAKNAIDDIRSVCDYFEKVHVPSRLKSELAAIKNSLSDMRKFVDSIESVFTATLISDMQEKCLVTADYVDKAKEFAEAEKSFFDKLDRLRNRGKKFSFVWL